MRELALPSKAQGIKGIGAFGLAQLAHAVLVSCRFVRYLVLATVERPATKWLKATVQAYDLSAKLLWSEEADSGGMAMTGKGAPEKTLKLLQKKLDPRIDKPGLPKKSPSASRS